MECNSGRNRASNFNFRFEITSLITPEFYDSNCANNKMRESQLSKSKEKMSE